MIVKIRKSNDQGWVVISAKRVTWERFLFLGDTGNEVGTLKELHEIGTEYFYNPNSTDETGKVNPLTIVTSICDDGTVYEFITNTDTFLLNEHGKTIDRIS